MALLVLASASVVLAGHPTKKKSASKLVGISKGLDFSLNTKKCKGKSNKGGASHGIDCTSTSRGYSRIDDSAGGDNRRRVKGIAVVRGKLKKKSKFKAIESITKWKGPKSQSKNSGSFKSKACNTQTNAPQTNAPSTFTRTPNHSPNSIPSPAPRPSEPKPNEPSRRPEQRPSQPPAQTCVAGQQPSTCSANGRPCVDR